VIRLTEKTHQELKKIIKPGDYVIDATAGNGHDTLFLAEQTGPSGHVYAFDIQKESIESSSQKIQAKEYHDRVSFFHSCHSKISEYLPTHIEGKIKAATFNLGYPPWWKEATNYNSKINNFSNRTNSRFPIY
jgi:ubiquinone/menaquinone biosynthesis C-methylase UbiE